MKTSSLVDGLSFGEEKPVIQLLLETDTTKEIRIALGKDQIMKKHQTKYPIVVEIFDGEIDFTVQGETHRLKRGAILALDASIMHELLGIEDSVVRLSLSKSDTIDRVFSVIRD